MQAQTQWPPGFMEAGKLLIKWTAERRAARIEQEAKAAVAAAAVQQDG